MKPSKPITLIARRNPLMPNSHCYFDETGQNLLATLNISTEAGKALFTALCLGAATLDLGLIDEIGMTEALRNPVGSA